MSETATPPPAVETPATQAATPADDYKAKYEETRKQLDKRTKEAIIERRQASEEKKTLGEKLSRLGELEKRELLAKRNPTEFMKSIYGEKWYDTVVETRLSGGTPTADMVASEIDKVREEYKNELAKRDEAANARAQQQSAAKLAEDTRQAKAAWAQAASEEKHPALLARYESAAAAAAAAFEHARAHFAKTATFEDGQWVQGTGEVLSAGQALEQLEAREREIIKKASARLTPAANDGSTPAKQQQQGSGQQQGAKKPQVTLSSSITASSTGTKPRSRDEALKKAEQKYAELQRKP